jgi:hypothetical protein
MANVTISLDDNVLEHLRWDAKKTGRSISRYIADLVAADQERLRQESVAAMEAFLSGPDLPILNDDGAMPSREELNVRPDFRGHKRDRVGPRWPVSDAAGPLRGVAEAARGFPEDGDQRAGAEGAPKRPARKARTRRRSGA